MNIHNLNLHEKKGTMERAHKKIIKNHNEIKKLKAMEVRMEKREGGKV